MKKELSKAEILRVIQHLKELDEPELKHELLTEAVKHLYNAIDIDDLLQLVNGQMHFQDRPLTPEEVGQIKEEAKQAKQMKLWQVLEKDVLYQLNKKMFHDSKITADLIWGKLGLFLFDVIRTRLKNL